MSQHLPTVGAFQDAIEKEYSCSALFIEVVPVKVRFDRGVVMEERIYVFDINGNPPVGRAYAYMSSRDDKPCVALAEPPLSVVDTFTVEMMSRHRLYPEIES